MFLQATMMMAQRGIPTIEINTAESTPIDSKEEYVNASIKIKNCPPQYGIINDSCKIRGRGNATWKDYPKKPYKIKLYNKQNLLGFPANKDWVLLAEYNDKSLLRTSYMCEVSKALEMAYTVNYQHVELTLNGEYLGVYVLTDQVERAKDRVNIEDDGFLIEDDNYYDREPLFFTSVLDYNYTFKYPNANKANIVKDDDNYLFIKNFIDEMENSLQAIPYDSDTYKNYIDIESFAKWYIANEVLGNWEPNLFYVLPSRESKLKMMPLWDAEWSLGLACKGNEQRADGWYLRPHESPSDIYLWKNRKYFQYLTKDPYFNEIVNNEWNKFKENLETVKGAILSKQQEIQEVQQRNFDKWPIMGKYIIAVMLVAFPTWQEEVEYAANYFEQRIQWLDINLNSSTTKVNMVIENKTNGLVYTLNGNRINPSNASSYPIIIKNGKTYFNSHSR